MALPDQVRKQAEVVQELYKQLNPDNSAGTEGTPPAEAAVPPDKPGEGAEDAPAAESTASFDKPGSADESEETVLQRYKTLQGMYNAEVPRLRQQNREMSQHVQQMEQLLASVSAQQPVSETTQPAATKLVTDNDVSEYGESIDVMRRVSREELFSVAQRIAQVEEMLRQMQVSVVPQVQNITHRQQMSAEQKFWADLVASVPNYREINGTEAFQSWLLDIDPLTGIARQTYLEDAQRNLDASRVANFFHTWLELTGQATNAKPTGAVSSSELQKQVAPGRSRSAGAPANGNTAKIYTPYDIKVFFNDVRMGKYKGREQERARTERDIFAAQRESRIQTSV